MDLAITPFNGTTNYTFSDERDKKLQTTQTVATGAAATATTALPAKKYMGGYLKNMLQKVTSTAKAIDSNASEATNMFKKFKLNSIEFAQDAIARLSKFKNNKFLGPIIKSKATQAVVTGFGALTAFFVLITEISDSVKTGKIAIDRINYAA